MTDDNLFELTPEQESAFKRMERAHNDCVKAGIYLYNDYGMLGAVDRRKISYYNDEPGEGAVCDEGQNLNCFQLACNEWADDEHYFHSA